MASKTIEENSDQQCGDQKAGAASAHEKVHHFLVKVFWDDRATEAELLTLASELPSIACLLDPYAASELDLVLAEIGGGAAIGKAIIDEWIAAFRAQKHEKVSYHNPLNLPLNAAIAAEISVANLRA